MIDFVLNIPSELETNQKHKPVITENQLARGIQSKSIRGLGTKHREYEVWGVKPPLETGGLGGRS